MQFGDIVGGRFQIEKPLGNGGLGRVFLATDLHSSTQVAIKVLLPELVRDPFAVEELKRDLRVSRMVGHPGVLRAYDLCETDGTYFLVSEYFASQSLEAFIRSHPGHRLPPLQVCRIALGVAGVIVALHEAGIYHGDIKPGNVLVDSRGNIKLIDFGSAVLPGETSRPLQAMSATAGYASPEQLLGRLPNAQSDVYSFGCLLVAMLTGDPSEAKTLPQTLQSLAPGMAPSRRKVLQSIVDNCLSPDPSNRPQSLVDVSRALEALSSAISASDKAPHWAANRNAAAACAVIVLVLLVVMARNYKGPAASDDALVLPQDAPQVSREQDSLIQLDLELQRVRQLISLGRCEEVATILSALREQFQDNLAVEAMQRSPCSRTSLQASAPDDAFPPQTTEPPSPERIPEGSARSQMPQEDAERSLATAEDLFSNARYDDAERLVRSMLDKADLATADALKVRELLGRIEKAKVAEVSLQQKRTWQQAADLLQQAKMRLDGARYDEAEELAQRSLALSGWCAGRELLQRIRTAQARWRRLRQRQQG